MLQASLCLAMGLLRSASAFRFSRVYWSSLTGSRGFRCGRCMSDGSKTIFSSRSADEIAASFADHVCAHHITDIPVGATVLCGSVAYSD
jgi:hypothetical protein